MSIDRLISVLDTGLRACAGVNASHRRSPAAGAAEGNTGESARAHAAALMRVNHTGEVCAQALYAGQALAARDPETRRSLEQAAREEQDHLAWCADRIHELGGRTSLLNPWWYAGSLAIGTVAGALGDRWSLAFLAATEQQVEEHLAGHLRQLPAEDARTRAVITQMQKEEASHRATAQGLGAAELPPAVRTCMRLFSGVMTSISYRL